MNPKECALPDESVLPEQPEQKTDKEQMRPRGLKRKLAYLSDYVVNYFLVGVNDI